MVEGASLESLYMGNCIVGSNPILSANKPVKANKNKLLRVFIFSNLETKVLLFEPPTDYNNHNT